MGNTGSAHNLQNDCVESELNSYCTQEYLRRTTGERRKKYNQILIDGWSNNGNIADCKVLPKPSENLRLRATSNGAILQAGGTISFRAKEQADVERRKDTETIYPMRRCHTLIIDNQNDAKSQRKSAPPSAEFRRSQTLLHVDYNRNKFQEKISTNFECPPQSQPQKTCPAPTLKFNKYNKKRKAPPAPTKISLKVDATNGGQNSLISDPTNTTLVKPRIYAPNTNKPLITQKHLQSPTLKVAPFQHNSNTRTSINSSTLKNQNNPLYITKLPYRREKSFDAKLLRHKNTNNINDGRCPTKEQMQFPNCPNVNKLKDKLDRNVYCDGNSKKKLTRLQDNKISTLLIDTCPSEKQLGDRKKIEKCFRQEETTQFKSSKDNVKCNNEDPALTNEQKTKHQQSRIPQLKRTFYFGMESSNKSTNIDVSPNQKDGCRSGDTTDGNEDIVLLNHKLEDEKEIVDNGILVHVRPTLPRRQPETPSFSPTAAWRNLVEEQQRLQLERSKPTQNNKMIETPICFTFNTTENYIAASTSWTPQQDLDDDDDDDNDHVVAKEVEQKSSITALEAKIDKSPENHTNSLHIFSLSLPRDVHLQCTEQENSLKATNCWLVPGFNSLQKFKTHLGKNTDLQPNNKCGCPTNRAFKPTSYTLQNILADPFAVESKSTQQADCELNKASFEQKIVYKNDNWLLHKSNTNDLSLTVDSKTLNDSSIKRTLNMISQANLQPKSLTNICGGKHIVYLPGQDACNASNKDSHNSPKQSKTTKPSHARQRQKQSVVRQSLQDLTPIQNIHQSNVSVTEKSTHRFSFQSTVRVLEKRRLAEKLSKNAEIHEAQRLNELEAMKRVEEDFKRKRAPEKAHLRNQLRLHLKTQAENGQYRSLPMTINKKDSNRQLEIPSQHLSDLNNNIFCRPEPDGAVSPYLGFNDNLPKVRHSNFPLSNENNSNELSCFEFGGEESESDTQLPDLQCTALLIEPYLHSII